MSRLDVTMSKPYVEKIKMDRMYPHNATLEVGRTSDSRDTPYISLRGKYVPDGEVISLTIHIEAEDMIELAEAITTYTQEHCI